MEQVLVESRAAILLAKLKMTPAMGGLDVELIFRTTGGGHQPRSEELVREFLEKYPASRAVFLVVKTMLSKKAIGDLGRGGLTSLSLLLLIVSVIQNQEATATSLKVQSTKAEQPAPGSGALKETGQPEVASPKIANAGLASLGPRQLQPTSPGKLLVDFLFWFGFRFNFSEFSVAVSTSPEVPSAVYAPRSAKGPALSVLHPCNPSIVTTKAFKHTEAFREWCKLTFNSLYSACVCQALKGPERHFGIPMIHFGHLKTQATVVRSTVSSTPDSLGTDLAVRIHPELRRGLPPDETASASDSKPPRRRRLSSRSQTYEARGEPVLSGLDLPADHSSGYALRRTLFCSAFNPPASLKFAG